MSIYADKLAHIQVFISCQYSVPQMCTCEDTRVHNLGALMMSWASYNSLTTAWSDKSHDLSCANKMFFIQMQGFRRS